MLIELCDLCFFVMSLADLCFLYF